MPLHVTNGDCAAAALRALPVDGDVLPWRDVLHDGPVPGGCGAAELRTVRARFIADAGWGPYDEVLADFTRRDGTLATATGEIVLWFEHDLYDQLQLVQVLDSLADAGRHVTLAQSDRHLTLLSAGELRTLGEHRHAVGRDESEVARRAWAAIRTADPGAMEELAGDDTMPLPHLAAALRRFLQELPSTRDGLSRTEAQTLAAIRDGADSIAAAFEASQRREDAAFLGDTSFASRLDALARCTSPLVRRSGDCIQLTPAGDDVLRANADHVEMNGADRWLGGVHLQGRDVWRWDDDACRVIAPRRRAAT